ncbi:MAG: Rieske 2Fe-2S domain-containing protein [Gammaproteobacteria bacterium]|nr:Rieske 2Fe-2S domain-containing protein [Gammaproteobacteria bacterium]NNC98483.1 Rieske 2Fe-2S domain-containing protein [Gammaproteobacteria bacterium]NNM12951.1 Rieske 2Fe-2S domain-containing protein [Gammaproteobacteria bacterium]
MPAAPTKKPTKKYFPICFSRQITDPGSKEFMILQKGRPYFGFLVQKNQQVFAYANTCPHQGRMLQWKPDAFLTKDCSQIMCSAHGATFEIDSGLCVAGPCLGQSLNAMPCKLVNDVVMVQLP